MNPADELGSLLLRVGNAADEIAITLRDGGIKGARNTARFLNPIVRYCQMHLIVDRYTLDVMQRGIMRITLPNEMPVNVPLPSPVMEFLDAFNRGAYPCLELSASN
jgi:hypothetical protein